MKKLSLIVLALAFALGNVPIAVAQNGGGTVSTLDQWTSSSSPSSSITQRTFGKAIRITGLATGQCLTLDSNNFLTTTTCGGGGGSGSGTVATSTQLVAGQVDFSTSASTIGNDSTFLFDTTNKRLTATNASTTALTVSGNLYLTGISSTQCLHSINGVVSGTGADCGSGSGGSSAVATSTNETSGTLSYWTSNSATPALLGKVSTSTLGFSGPFNGFASIGALVGGSNTTITWTGLATTSQPASSNLLTSNGGAGVYGTATSTLTATSPLTGSFTQVGTGGALGCQTASGSLAGCLSSADWTTFNSKQTSALAKGNFLVGNDAGVAQATSTIFITSTGRIGIGTQTPTDVNANAWLTVAGISSQDIIASTTDNTTLSDAILQAYAPGSRIFMGAHGTNQVSSRYGLTLGGWGEIGAFNSTSGTTNGLIIGTNPAVPIVIGTNNKERIRILSTGEVGIASTSPHAQFSVHVPGTSATKNIAEFSYATGGAADNATTTAAVIATSTVPTLLVGTSTPFGAATANAITLSSGTTGTTTLNFGEVGNSSAKTCINIQSDTGAIFQLFIHGSSLQVVSGACTQ